MYISVHHNAEDDFGTACGTEMRGHGGADFFAIDAFVHAVSVCMSLLELFGCRNVSVIILELLAAVALCLNKTVLTLLVPTQQFLLSCDQL